MSNHGLFIGGVPTEPDVKRLLDAFKNLKDGDMVSHDDIAKAIGVERTTNRYRNVTNAWRKHLLKVNNLRLAPLAGLGFRVLDGMDRVTHNVKQYGRGARQIRKAADDVRRVDIGKLPQNEQRVTEHVLRHMEATSDHLRKASKEMSLEFKPQDQLPRVRAVK